MRSKSILLSALLPLATLLWFAGCGTPSADPAASPPENGQASQAEHDHGEHDHADADAGEFAEQLAKLSPEDRAAAEQQKICPVSDEPLGSMGVPPKVTVDGRELFLCCENCEEMLRKEPEKYLEKLAN